MKKYYLKSREVKAFKWTGDLDQIEDPEWIIEEIKSRRVEIIYPEMIFYDSKYNAYAWAFPGWWIVKNDVGFQTYDEQSFKNNYFEVLSE